jgi:uncharacterized sporulation protein YeaH/YhbH (DUF444 family)
MQIIDRRQNPGGKSSPNRQRFIKRAKEAIRESIKEKIQGRKIDNTSSGENIVIPKEGINEPSFGHDYDTGKKSDVRPGNKNYNVGDKIKKPPRSGGGGAGRGEGSDDPTVGEDEFEFALSKKEFYDIFFEDLELPNLQDKEINEIKQYKIEREGFRKDGSMSNLDLIRSYKNSLGRRMALARPPKKKLQELLDKFEAAESQEEKDKFLLEIEKLKKKFRQVPFFDENDMRFRNFTKKPKPNSKAVMFCVMDVSFSMGEHEKDLSKRFFMLLYMFLERKYEQTDIIFIRHHTDAKECDEDEFFHSHEAGGTVVSSAMNLLVDIQRDRYPTTEWNVYVAQCSDGDNNGSDTPKVIDIIKNKIMPRCQYFAYIQTEYSRDSYRNMYFDSDYGLWPNYEELETQYKNFEMRQVSEAPDIWNVFVELFKKQDA